MQEKQRIVTKRFPKQAQTSHLISRNRCKVILRTSSNTIVHKDPQRQHSHAFRARQSRHVCLFRPSAGRKVGVVRRDVWAGRDDERAVEAGHEMRDVSHVGRGVHWLFLVDLDARAKALHVFCVGLA